MESIGFRVTNVREEEKHLLSKGTIQVNGPVIVGAGPAGLAVGACLREQEVPFFVVVDRADCIASLWQKRTCNRLKLHLPKQFFQLPFPKEFPEYPTKKQFISYLESYVNQFQINPQFNESVQSAKYNGTLEHWLVKMVKTGAEEEVEYVCRWLVVATGENAEKVVQEINGLRDFVGEVIQAYDYISGEEFQGKRVLIIGCRNSGMKVSLDLSNYNVDMELESDLDFPQDIIEWCPPPPLPPPLLPPTEDTMPLSPMDNTFADLDFDLDFSLSEEDIQLCMQQLDDNPHSPLLMMENTWPPPPTEDMLPLSPTNTMPLSFFFFNCNSADEGDSWMSQTPTNFSPLTQFTPTDFAFPDTSTAPPPTTHFAFASTSTAPPTLPSPAPQLHRRRRAALPSLAPQLHHRRQPTWPSSVLQLHRRQLPTLASPAPQLQHRRRCFS